MKKKRQRVPAPYNKWIKLAEWKQIPKSDRKILTGLTAFQKSMKKHFKDHPPEPYINMNAEIEYERSMGLR